MDRLFSLFKFAEVRAESEKKISESQQARSSQIWPRLLFFSPSQECDDDEENREGSDPPPPVNVETTEEQYCEEDDNNNNSNNDDDDDDVDSRGGRRSEPTCSHGFSKKLGCMYHGARFGLREGALTGAFFGGGLGMYKYFDSVVNGGGDKGGSDDGNESTLNDNIIFVTAANGAIAMAVFCTLFCSTKAMIYCN